MNTAMERSVARTLVFFTAESVPVSQKSFVILDFFCLTWELRLRIPDLYVKLKYVGLKNNKTEQTSAFLLSLVRRLLLSVMITQTALPYRGRA